MKRPTTMTHLPHCPRDAGLSARCQAACSPRPCAVPLVIVATLALCWGRAAFGVERSGAPRAASPAIMPTTWRRRLRPRDGLTALHSTFQAAQVPTATLGPAGTCRGPTRPDGHHNPSSFDQAGTGHDSRGTAGHVTPGQDGHKRSIEPQVSGHMTPSVILDVEELTGQEHHLPRRLRRLGHEDSGRPPRSSPRQET